MSNALNTTLDNAVTKKDRKNIRAILMLSGGLDSVALLANILTETDHKLHVHHIEIANFERRDLPENDALEKILSYFRSNYRDFDYSTSRNEFGLGAGGGLDLTLSLFTASRVYTALGGGIDIVYTGHKSLRMRELVEGATVFNACYVNKQFSPEWLWPLDGVTEIETHESIPEELAEMTWSCRKPVFVDETYRACGKCYACKTKVKRLSLSRTRVAKAIGKAESAPVKTVETGPNPIELWRIVRDLKQSELAELAGIPVAELGELEAGGREASAEVVARIAAALNVGVDKLGQPHGSPGGAPGKQARRLAISPEGSKSEKLEAMPISPKFKYKVNRAGANFEASLFNLMPQIDKLDRKIFFTYWLDAPYDFLEEDAVSAEWQVFKILERPILNKLSNKKKLAQILTDKGIEGLFPVTYVTREAALAHRGPPVDVWFLKNYHGTSGRGMRCVSTAQLADYPIPTRYIIQAGVSDIELINGRKFTTRIYVFIWNGQVYLYENGFNIVHGVDYEKGSTDFTVQIKHEGYRSRNSPVKLIPFIEYENYESCFGAYRAAVAKLMPALDECIAASSPTDYIMLGVDGLPLRESGVQLIEINTNPNFIHTDTINATVNVPFFEACLGMMFGLPNKGLVAIE